MTDDILLNRRKKMGCAGWMLYDDRSKNHLTCAVVDLKGDAKKEGWK